MKQQEPLTETKRSQDIQAAVEPNDYLPNWHCKAEGQRISDTLRLGRKNKPKNNRQEQTRMLAQGCFGSDNQYITHCRIFPTLRKGSGTMFVLCK